MPDTSLGTHVEEGRVEESDWYMVTGRQKKCLVGDHEAGDPDSLARYEPGLRIVPWLPTTYCRHCRCLYVER